ncbi:MAG TPA: FAD-dependent oxidoreductase [Clostridiaceae bacterium]|nr:FAD-dependent oxidoreductase [Clostridiaceae bacterium]
MDNKYIHTHIDNIADSISAKRDFKAINVIKDFVVVGGGLAGTCAAIAAARNGLKVALVQDRPILGGNSSSEIRVWSLGAIGGGNFFYEETGIIGEMKLENLYRNSEGNPYFWDAVLLDFVKREENIELFLNTFINEVTTDPKSNSIVSCTGWQMGSEKKIKFHAPIFADCTGDGTLGYLAGAEYMMGREGRDVYGESMAPDKGDNYTLGSSIFFYTKKTDRKVRYVKPDFAYDAQKIKQILANGNRIVSVKGSGCDYWWFEFGGTLNTISDNEKIKDELQKLVYGIWDYIKNSGEFDADYYTLEWISYIPGKRESRRLLGDYVLKQDDLVSQRIFEDAACYGGWSIDTHPPEGIYSKEPACKQIKVGVYTIPLRSMYSKNINNLLFAGRNISASHIAFASTRVMNTTAMMGHAIGTAAYFCINNGVSPRGIYEDKALLENYKNQLLKEDCTIIGMKNSDPMDIARQAKVSASSFRTPQNIIPVEHSKQIVKDLYITFPVVKNVNAFQILMDVNEDTNLEAALFIPDRPQNFIPERLINKLTLRLNKGKAIWVDIPVNIDIEYTGPAILKISPNPNLGIYESKESCTGIFYYFVNDGRRVYNPCFRYKTNSKKCSVCDSRDLVDSSNVNYSEDKNDIRSITDINNLYIPENVTNGYNRPYILPNLWISGRISRDKSQYIDLRFDEEKTINEIVLFFNPNLNTERNNLRPGFWKEEDSQMPKELVKEYKIYALDDNGNHLQPKRLLIHERNNKSRYVRLSFSEDLSNFSNCNCGIDDEHVNEIKAKGIRIEVIDTWGNPYAEIFEVRVY